MLDIQFIRENSELVKEKSKQKGYDVDVDHLLSVDRSRRELQQAVDEKRRQRNEHAANFKDIQGATSQENVDKGKALKSELAELDGQFEKVEEEFEKLLKAVPNMPLDYVPVGSSEQENQVVKTVGEPKHFDFTPKHDFELGEAKDLIDKERAAKIAGSRFAYLKGGLVRLQFAIVQFVLEKIGDEHVIAQIVQDNNLRVSTKPFTPILPPAVLRTAPYEASARLNAEEVTYKLADDDLWLNASAEHTLCTMYWNEILPGDQFPIRYLGYSTSFRREAGTYGKDEEGIFRMHQFDKLEMESFATPETGLDEHKLQIAVQEYLVQQLGLPYQFIQKCTADIGKPNAAGVDLNSWFPAQNAYRETHTADYMTDYQARDLKIRVRRADGSLQLVHTADATAFAMGRTLKAIMENYQTAEGHIIVPDVLRTYMNGQTEI
jgi:seryl-tRNA synthetase